MTTEQTTTVELTSFALTVGADEAAFVAAAARMQESFLEHQDGFVSRTLVKGEAGWTDIVYWRDPAAMHQAVEQAGAVAEVAPFLQMIDPASLRMGLSEIKLSAQ